MFYKKFRPLLIPQIIGKNDKYNPKEILVIEQQSKFFIFR